MAWLLARTDTERVARGAQLHTPSVQVVCVGGGGWFSCEEFLHQVYGACVDFISRIRTFPLFVICLRDLSDRFSVAIVTQQNVSVL